MRNLIFRYRFQFLLILIGLIWISFLNECLQISYQNIIFNDSDNYRESAHLWYHHFKSHYFRPLGMALISGLPYIFGGTDQDVYRFSLVINICCWLGSALLLFEILKKQFSTHKAFVFSLLYLSVLGCVFINFHLLTESIFTFMMLLVVYFLQKYCESKSFWLLSVAISLLLIAMLVKPGIKFLAVFVVVYFGKILIQNFKHRSSILVYLSLSLLIFQCAKMKMDYGDYTISYIDGVTFYNYIGSKALCFKTNAIFDQSNNKRAVLLEKFSYKQQRIVAKRDLVEQLKDNKINLVGAYISNVAENTKTESGAIAICQNLKSNIGFDIAKRWLLGVSKYQNQFFSIVGFILALFYFFRSKNDILYGFISCYILYIIGISGVSCGQGDRFHLVFFPFVIILIAKFVDEWMLPWVKLKKNYWFLRFY